MTAPDNDTTSRSSDGDATGVRSPARRRLLFGSVAVGAAAAGVGLSWWQAQPTDGPGPTTPHPLWDMAFPTPDGGTLAMQTLAGKPLLLNFWATWCPPCVEEMPLLDRFYAENSANGWQVLGMAVDQQAAVSRFLTRHPVRFPITLAGMSGVELSLSLGNQGGGLPFTVVFNGSGHILQRKIGRVSPQELHDWRALRQ